jgi:hypothetical protein
VQQEQLVQQVQLVRHQLLLGLRGQLAQLGQPVRPVQLAQRVHKVKA